jgi:hypothetical protein
MMTWMLCHKGKKMHLVKDDAAEFFDGPRSYCGHVIDKVRTDSVDWEYQVSFTKCQHCINIHALAS